MGIAFTSEPDRMRRNRASLSLMSQPPFAKDLERIETKTHALISGLKDRPNILTIQQLGTIGALKLASEGSYFAGNKLDIPALARKEGVLLRPLGNMSTQYRRSQQRTASSKKIYGVIKLCLDKWS